MLLLCCCQEIIIANWRLVAESEEDIFVEIDELFSQREWTPPPPSTPLCGLCISTQTPEHPATGMLLNSKVWINLVSYAFHSSEPDPAAIFIRQSWTMEFRLAARSADYCQSI